MTEQQPPRDPEAVAQELLREHPEFDQVPAIETDETVPPRPEEDVADATRDWALRCRRRG